MQDESPMYECFTKRYYFPVTSILGTGNYLLAKGKRTMERD
jgi:hypothetical protein